MDTRSRGKRLAGGITATVGAGSLAVAGVAAAAVYAATPSVIARTTPATGSSTQQPGATNLDSGAYGSQPNSGTRRQKGYGNSGGTTPVQPGNGGTVHGRSSGS